jgi:hypothetical protein
MPEELENTEAKELSEQELAEEEAAFDGKELPPDDKEKEGDDEKPEEKADEVEDKPAEEVEEEEEETEAEEKETEPEEEKEEESAVDVAEKRAQELFGDEDKEPEKEPSAGKPEPGEFKITKEEAAGYMDAFPVDELPEQIVIGDKTVNLKDLATDEDTEDIFNAMAVVSGHLTKKMVAEELEKAGFVKQETFEGLQAELKAERDYNAYMAALQEVHPDVRKIERSKGFNEWADKQGSAMKKLIGSPDADHGIMAINAYKESIAKTKAAKHDETASVKKKRKDDLHKHSAREKESKRGADTPGDMADEKAGWKEGAEEE